MGKVSTVEIKGHQYRYEYVDGKTLYRGPVGDAPALSESEFMRGFPESKLPSAINIVDTPENWVSQNQMKQQILTIQSSEASYSIEINGIFYKPDIVKEGISSKYTTKAAFPKVIGYKIIATETNHENGLTTTTTVDSNDRGKGMTSYEAKRETLKLVDMFNQKIYHR